MQHLTSKIIMADHSLKRNEKSALEQLTITISHLKEAALNDCMSGGRRLLSPWNVLTVDNS